MGLFGRHLGPGQEIQGGKVAADGGPTLTVGGRKARQAM